MAPFMNDRTPTPRRSSPESEIPLLTARLDERLRTSSKHVPDPIAICGMAVRLPGGIMNCAQFWDFLVSKGDARCKVPENRYNLSGHYSKSGKPGFVKNEYGYFLNDVDLGSLDTTFFTLPKTELERCDPHQRQLLEVVGDCFRNAGEVNTRGKSIGCYIGTFGEDWAECFFKDTQHYGVYRISGYGDFTLSNRISYEYDLKGPSMTIRTGCSSALIGLHEACVALERGDCSAAIVGGANLILAPGMSVAMYEQGVLSPTGSCKSFSADADGYARGEAINAVYIKRLSDAIRDGNPIRGVIRATASNCDGKTAGMTLPSSESHESMIRRAYQVADITDVSQTAFVECHGTGTQIGDPIEVSAIANVFGDSGVYIGSVKPNVGHSEGASGITSLIKSVLALENQRIPPNIRFTSPNPKIPFKEKNLTVPVEPTPWPQDRCERVSVNSFGIGGANAHVIIDSARSFFGCEDVKAIPMSAPQLLTLSANTTESLRRQTVSTQQYLERRPEVLNSLAYTLASRRDHLVHRTFAVVGQDASFNAAPFVRAPKTVPELVMIFTGQGAQWPRMGAELLQHHSVFRQSIEALDRVLQALKDAPKWSIMEELLQPEEFSNLSRASFSQPLCTAVQLALVDCLASINVHPYAVIGHSSGEMAAAYAAGKLTAPEAIIAAYYRGVVSEYTGEPGGMAAVGLGWKDTEQFLIDGVVIACENSSSSVTISGDLERVGEVVNKIKEAHPDKLARALKVDKAYHSHHMKQLGPQYYELAKHRILAKPSASDVVFFSSVTGKLLEQSESLTARYWQSNLESPVLFRTAVANLLEYHTENSEKLCRSNDLVFLECGPHSALAGPLRQILAEASTNKPYASLLTRGKDAQESFLTAIGQLYCQNIPLDFDALTNPLGDASVLTDLDPYPYHHDGSFMYESRLSKEWRLREFPKHELLGLRIPESTHTEPCWRNMFHLNHVSWVRDHNIKGDVIFPCAGYVGMVGEAVRQLTTGGNANTNFAGFTLRGVSVKTAMVLNDSKPTEIVTSLKKYRLTEQLESVWYDFTISSHNGNAWLQHCIGQVRAVEESGGKISLPEPLPRKVSSQKLYTKIAEIGANYGPYFQGLAKITSATNECTAAGKAIDTIAADDEAVYSVHPTKIDFFLQLSIVSASMGILRMCQTMRVPTAIDEMTIWNVSGDLLMNITTTTKLNDKVSGHGQAISTGGDVALTVKGVSLSPLEEDESNNPKDPHAAAKLGWQPDLDFLDASKLIQPVSGDDVTEYTSWLQKLNALCSQEALLKLSLLNTDRSHMEKFRSWLETQAPRPFATEPIMPKIQALVESLMKTPAAPYAICMMRILENVEDIFLGRMEVLELLMAEKTLTEVYNFMSRANRTPFFQSLGHSKPCLRILEVGAGTGGTTSKILQGLVHENGHLMYAKYTFTDISAGFFTAAQERLKDWPNMEYKALDITRDPSEQGFELGHYDLVIATNVLHATPDLQTTLINVRKLLNPGGRLFMEELCCDVKATNFIFGTLEGWWLGAADGRESEPYVSPERWDFELKKAGFAGLDVAVLDAQQPAQLSAIMVAKPATVHATRPVAILCDDISQPLAEKFRQSLASCGVDVSFCDIESDPPADRDILALVDVQRPFFYNLGAATLRNFQEFVSNIGDAGVFWVTRSAQLNCQDPRFAQSLGVIRCIKSEFAIDFATCEIDEIANSKELILATFGKFCQRRKDEELTPEYEYAISNGVINVGRFYPFVMKAELVALNEKPTESPVLDLTIGKYGRLGTLQWTAKTQRQLEDDQVEIDMKTVGMNFKDVLIAMGIVSSTSAALGLEGAGIVTRTGPSTKDLSVGDRVFVLGAGCFSTSLVASEKACEKIPDTLSFEDAATMPCVFGTVIYSLLHVGRLEPDQTVLIHSACGGVGIAAIQICQMLGAEIYATVGSEEKIQYLMSTFGLPRSRIFHSRDASFFPDVLSATNGRGVDLVLNSLSGELLHASWQCVAEFGTMLEIGKRDLIGHGKLAMDIFEANRSYCGIDLGHLIELKPTLGKRLLKEIIQFYSQGHIKAINPIKRFRSEEVVDCFRYMQKGTHIGKIVVSMELDAGQSLPSANVPIKSKFSPDAAYVLIGGLGGLGKAVSSWMVDNGARHLVFLSRSAGNSDTDQSFLAELKSQGCSAIAIQGSASRFQDVQKTVLASEMPLKGIFQMSMVLRDQSITAMTIDEWNGAVSPKVCGTMNLHKATKDMNLDFFVMFSSISGIIGLPGQANYASANTFLDAFVQFRHSQGLPASSIDIGSMEDTGYVAENAALLKRLRSQGYYGIHEAELLDALTFACAVQSPNKSNLHSSHANTTQFSLGLRSNLPLSSPNNQQIWRKDRRMAFYHVDNETSDTAGPTSETDNKLKEFLESATAQPSLLKEKSHIVFLARQIAIKLFNLLLRPVDNEEEIDVSSSLGDAGLDSLVAIEMRSWWKTTFGFDISVLEMLNMESLEALGKHAANRLMAKLDGGKEEGKEVPHRDYLAMKAP